MQYGKIIFVAGPKLGPYSNLACKRMPRQKSEAERLGLKFGTKILKYWWNFVEFRTKIGGMSAAEDAGGVKGSVNA